jgi:hypothetical protein
MGIHDILHNLRAESLAPDLPPTSGDNFTLKPPRHFDKPAEAVRQLHLPWRPALRFKQGRAGDDERGTPSAGSGDVKPVEGIEEFHPPWRVLRRRGGH